MTMTIHIDTKIRHVTEPGTNIFLELGFASDEAERYQAELQEIIYSTCLLKKQLVDRLATEIATRMEKDNLKQKAIADMLHVTRPRVSDIVNRKTSKFSIDALVNMLARVGRPVKLMMG